MNVEEDKDNVISARKTTRTSTLRLRKKQKKKLKKAFADVCDDVIFEILSFFGIEEILKSMWVLVSRQFNRVIMRREDYIMKKLVRMRRTNPKDYKNVLKLIESNCMCESKVIFSTPLVLCNGCGRDFCFCKCKSCQGCGSHFCNMTCVQRNLWECNSCEDHFCGECSRKGSMSNCVFCDYNFCKRKCLTYILPFLKKRITCSECKKKMFLVKWT